MRDIDKILSGRSAKVLSWGLVAVAMVLTIAFGPVDSDGERADPRGTFLLIAGVVSGPYAVIRGAQALARRQAIIGLPTSKALAVFSGVNELRGTVHADPPLIGPFSEEPLVHSQFLVSRRSGKSYRVEASGEQYTPFELRDETGSVMVRIDEATIDAPRTYEREGVLRGRSARWIEWGLRQGQEVLLIGTASLEQGRDELVIDDDADPVTPFFISGHPDSYERSQGRSTWLWWAWALVAASASAAGLSWLFDVGRPLTIGLVYAATVFVVCFVAITVSVRNALAASVVRLDAAWSLIAVELQRRRDLIPALAAVAEADQEWQRLLNTTATHLRVTEIGNRADADVRGTGAALGHDDIAARKVLATGEALPNLDTDGTTRNLLAELRDCTDRIAYAEQYFNDAVEVMRTRAETIPGRIAARFVDVPTETLDPAAGLDWAADHEGRRPS